MNTIEKQLLNVLKTIEGNGSFVTSGISKFTLPGLHIEGIGEISMPLNSTQIEVVISMAKKAPFGIGSQTITDTSVRSAWEVDAEHLSFHNEEWGKLIRTIVKKIKKGLGIEKQTVVSSLYKLLIYEETDFFLPHKDSEKEPGMFATLVVALPSKHTGGELIVRFDGREEIIDFSSFASNYKIPYAAFFADCEHEIKPITSGHRVCLVYNLLQSARSKKIRGPQFMAQADEMSTLLQSMAGTIGDKPEAILLGHQYTPANFSLARLKHHDRPRAEALLAAAEKAGYFARLGLVTHYLMGDLEGDFYDEYRHGHYYDESGGGTMGDVHEQYTTIEYWSEDEGPALGKVAIWQDDLLTDLSLGEGDPVEQAQEGFTGNAGMTIEYWYHYGAVVLWPKNKHFDILAKTAAPIRLQWMEYYLKHWNQKELQPKKHARLLIATLVVEDEEKRKYRNIDFSALAATLVQLKDEKFVKKNCQVLLPVLFDKIKVKAWTKLLQNYPSSFFNPVFEKVANTEDISVIDHLLRILAALDHSDSEALDIETFILHHVQQMPDYLKKVKLHRLSEFDYSFINDRKERTKTIKSIIKRLLELSRHKKKDHDWQKAILNRITQPLTREYVNEVLVPILLRGKYKKRTLTKALFGRCILDLEARTKTKPIPPSDWKRKIPNSTSNQHLWELLRPFLSSSTQQVYEYRKNESYRKEMERAIKYEDVDLRMETVRKGSPYTLKLIKTQAAYERALEEWTEDVKLLGALNGN